MLGKKKARVRRASKLSGRTQGRFIWHDVGVLAT